MCLFIKLSKIDRLLLKLNIKHNPKPKRAKKDINVYKVLKFTRWYEEMQYFTPFRCYLINFFENVSELPKCKMTVNQNTGYTVTTGYHAFIHYSDALKFRFNLDINAGIFDAIIPKGTKYFIGDSGDIVSEKLIIKQR